MKATTTSTVSSAARLRQLELAVLRRLDGLLQGDVRGLIPGRGSEAGEARVYLPGDDVRRIDWNVTARSYEPHVRDTIVDRECELTIVADLSPSQRFGTAERTKAELVLAGAAAVGLIAGRGANRVGAVLATPSGVKLMPPRSGRAWLMGVLREVSQIPEIDGGGIDLTAVLEQVARTARRRGLVVVISDFIATPGWERPLRALASRHDVLAIEVLDPRELELPDVGWLTAVDPETGRSRTVNTASIKLRQRYATAARERREVVANSIRRAGVSHLVLRTDQDWVRDISRYVLDRRRIAARATRSAS